MKDNPFLQKFEHLPPSLAVFPLSGVLLLPSGNLPLNIFEPRYLNMVEDAMRTDRLIGMVQPDYTEQQNPQKPKLCQTGCVGRITSYNETEDGRILINLTGLYRFRIVEEIETSRGYRRIHADWTGFEKDLDFDEKEKFLNRAQMMPVLKKFFEKEGMMCSWDAIEATNDWRLVTILSMICPFTDQEKQLLLEAETACARAATLMTLLEMDSVLSCSQNRH